MDTFSHTRTVTLFVESPKDLQERVSHLMIDILRHVTPKSEEGNDEAVVKVVKGIEEDIKQLLRCAPTNCGPRS